MNQAKSVIVLLGPQGSGKGTQGKKLAAKLSFSYLETGQLLRNEIASASEQGKYISSIIDSGALLPDEFTNEFMGEKISAALIDANGLIIDGYPRRIGQAEALSRFTTPTYAILIDISDNESLRRLAARRQCPKDKRIYNLITNPPQQGEVCDDCGTKLEQRVDDTPAAIQERLNLYHSDTEPILAWYEKQGILRRIDGTPDIPAVEESIWNIFK